MPTGGLSAWPDRHLPSPKLPLLDHRHTLALAADRALTCAPRRSAPVEARCLAGFVAASVAESRVAIKDVEIYVEKWLFDSFRPINFTLSTASALGLAVVSEAQRTGWIPADVSATDDPPDPEPMDWWQVGSNSALALARDVGGATTQRAAEKLAKPRLADRWYKEMVKSVPKMARQTYLCEIGAGRSNFAARCTTLKHVYNSPIYFMGIAMPRLLADVAIDCARTFVFPSKWRSRLSVASFKRNCALKTLKYTLQGVASLVVASLTPLAFTHWAAFWITDLAASLGADAVVTSFCGTVE